MSRSTSKGQRALPPESGGPGHLLEVRRLFFVSSLASACCSPLIPLIYLKLGKQVKIGKNAGNASNIHTHNAEVHTVLCGRQSISS